MLVLFCMYFERKALQNFHSRRLGIKGGGFILCVFCMKGVIEHSLGVKGAGFILDVL